MPRAWEIPVEPYPEIDVSHDYLVSVLSVKKSKSPRGISVVLQHLDADQADRKHSIVLPLPIRPSGLTAEFFQACGMEVAVGGKLSPKDTVGTTIKVRFLPAETGEGYKAVAFGPVDEEETENEQRDSEPEQHEPTIADAEGSP